MVWNHQELKELEKYTSYDLAQKLRGVLEKQARGTRSSSATRVWSAPARAASSMRC